MNKLILILLILVSQFSIAQQAKYAENNPLYKDVDTYFAQKNYAKALEISKTLEEIYPLDYEVYQKLSDAYFYSAKYDESVVAINNVIALDPFYYYNHLVLIRNGLYAQNASSVKTGINMLSLTCKEGTEYNYSINFLNTFKEAFKNYNSGVNAENLKTIATFENSFITNKSKKEELLNYEKRISSFDTFKIDADFKSGLNILKELQTKSENGSVNNLFYNYFIEKSSFHFEKTKYKNEIEKMNNLVLSNKNINPLQAFAIYKSLITSSVNPTYIKEISKIIESKIANYNNTLRTILFTNLLKSEYDLGNTNERNLLRDQIKVFLPLVKNHYAKIELYQWLAASYQYNNDTEGLRIINEGLTFAKQNGYANSVHEANLNTIKNLLLNSSGQNTKIITKDDGNHSTYFNIAMQHLAKNEYTQMSEPLEKAKKIIENNYKDLSVEEKKNNLVYYNKVCSNLLGSYMGRNNAKAVETIEAYKSFYLSSLVKNSTSISSAASIQKTLKNDEALIYLMKANVVSDDLFMAVVVDNKNINQAFLFTSGLMSILTVKYKEQYIQLEKENAKLDYRIPIYNQNPVVIKNGSNGMLLNGDIRRIIDVYREHLHPNTVEHPNFSNEPKVFGNIFYRALFQPLEGFLAGKTKLIFSLDQELNLIPFETLVTDDKKYLIEKYDISYIQNGSMLVNLRNQSKVTYPKNIIAFCDAKYEKMASNGKQFTDLSDLVALNFEVADKIDKNLPLNDAFATFSKEAMKYLEGTKREVENIQKMIPKSDVKMDKLMTENEFKRMAKSGELNNYRVIHLASHASVHRWVFDLSGIAFSVPAHPIDGEDGILVVKELEKLKFKTDFVMLSACQTGLGQIIPGEGVIGLNSALFSAGAKNTLTSLWSVNDYATSIFTTNLYQKIFNENKSYSTAVNEVKREFITGKHNTEFNISHPNYWAAFTLYGE